MTFRVLLHPKVSKAILELPAAHQKRLTEVLDILQEAPVPFKRFDVKKLKGQHNRFRIRLGEFRLIYEVDREEMLVLLLKLEKRGEAYK